MCAKSLSVQYVYLTSWLGTLALLDLFVFDTSYICLDRSGLRILIVDDDDNDNANHLTLFYSDTIDTVVSRLIEFSFSPSSSAPCHSFKILPPSLPPFLPSSRPSNQIKEAKSKKSSKRS